MMAQLGFRTIDEMIGRTDKLEMAATVDHWKAKGLDFSKILYQPDMPAEVGRYQTIAQDHGLEERFDNRVLQRNLPSSDRRRAKSGSHIGDKKCRSRRGHNGGQ